MSPFNYLPKSHDYPASQLAAKKGGSTLASSYHRNGVVPSKLSFDPIIATTNIIVVDDTESQVPWYYSSVSFSNVVILSGSR